MNLMTCLRREIAFSLVTLHTLATLFCQSDLNRLTSRMRATSLDRKAKVPSSSCDMGSQLRLAVVSHDLSVAWLR